MKRSVLFVSLIVIVAGSALVAGLIRLKPGPPAQVAGAGAATAKTGRPGGGGGGAAAARAESEALSADQKVRLSEVGRALLSPDLKTLVANLRTAGFPPSIVRAIVAATIEDQYAERRRKILGDRPVPPYWKAESMAAQLSNPQMAELRTLAREEQDTLKQLLGPDSATSELNRYMQQRAYGDLAPEKIDAVQRIRQDYGELRAQIYAEAGTVMLPADREKLAMLEQEQRGDLAALLTPEELQQYDLRNSSTAQRMRTTLAAFNPTEQEFLAIYNLQSQFDQSHNTFGMAGMMDPEQQRQRRADQAQLQTQIKATLGDQRYQAYQQSMDPGFQAANRIVTTLQLPPENVAAMWNLQESTQQQAGAIRADRSLPSEQRSQALATLAAQTGQQLTNLLTPAGADAYRQTPGGLWLRSLEPPPRRPVPPPSPVPGGSSSTAPATPVPAPGG